MSKLLQIYLKFWAKKYLERTKPKIVAITGSVGKTSVKEAIFEVLNVKFGQEVRKSEGNLNNETGLPLAVLNFSKAPSYADSNLNWIQIILAAPIRCFALKPVKILVLEFAADKPGDIKYLTSIARPDIAVLTTIAPAHLEAFGTMEKITEEKTELLRALNKNGWAVLGIDSELVKKSSYGGWWQKKTYAICESADVQATKIESVIKDFKSQTNFEVNAHNKVLKVSQNTLGNAFVLASLAAVAVGEILEVTGQDMIQGLANLKLEKHRMNVLEGKNKTIILDDCYNANPVSMRAALEVLKNLPHGLGRKIVVLGEMREIGKISDQAHQEIGQIACQIADLTISVGKGAKKYNANKHFDLAVKAGEYLLNETKIGDIILIKASRGAGAKPMLAESIEVLKK